MSVGIWSWTLEDGRLGADLRNSLIVSDDYYPITVGSRLDWPFLLKAIISSVKIHF